MDFSAKQAGTLYEQLFIAESIRRGLQPHVPIGDYLPHDIVVYGEDGVCHRVQVKGTHTHVYDRKYNKSPRYRITAATGRDKKKINCEDVDILACYLANWDIWYIIPCIDITSACVWLYPTGKGGQYEKYKNNWRLFKKEGDDSEEPSPISG
jgi:hypothetical protein